MGQIILSRMRQGCSPLRADLYHNIHVLPDPHCSCGALEEMVNHYLLECPKYKSHRDIMFNTLRGITEIKVETLIYGNDNLTKELNSRVQEAVISFILHSSRFHPP